MGAIRHRYAFVATSAALLVGAVVVMLGFQKDYMPEMDEGSILYMPTTLPGLPSREAGWILQQMDKKLKAFPEVERVFGKLGRADTATDPAPVEMVETTVMLKPASQWRPGLTKDALIAELNQAMDIVGYVNSWTQPISTRVVMQDTGIQTPVGIKVTGDDLAVVEDIAHRIETLLRNVPGTQAVIAERISQGSFVDARLDLRRMAERGVTVDEAMSTVRYAIGGDNVVSIRQADKAIVPLSVQYSAEYIDTLDKVRTTPVVTERGESVPLGEIADVSVRQSPEMIRNDNGALAGYVYIYLRGITGPDYVDNARAVLSSALTLPPGYGVEWTGIFTYAEAARATLRFVVPITLVIMFGLLLVAFRSVADSVLIMLSAPFALVGGVFLQWALGYTMTTAVIIGYVSLFAVAIQTGIIMIEFIREALARRPEEQSYMDAVVTGSVSRLRPKLMTVATTVLGLLPIMLWSTSGLDIAKPIATPTFGGMISSTVYVLFLIPCLFAIGEDLRRRGSLRRPVVGTVSLLLVAALTVGCGDGRAGEQPSPKVGAELPSGTPPAAPQPSATDAADSTAGQVTIEFAVPEPLRTGDNELVVSVTGADGAPLVDGTVQVTLTMPAMRTTATLAHEGNGRYRGTADLSMGGTWNVSVTVSRGATALGSKRLSVVASGR
jgi:Cu(I)/Ag(I) efflux system membrane protein CusA/SilA